MPVPYQIIPEHVYPHQHVQINDNTEVRTSYSNISSEVTALLCVFASPKGRDNKVLTIDEGSQGFINEYGIGPFSLYGQPLLNAYNAAMSGACTLHCMRVTPDDASYSNVTLIAKYKVEESAGDDGQTTKNLKVMYYAKSSNKELATLDDLDVCCTVSGDPDEEGFTSVKLLTVGCQGKGIYGKNLRFRITSDRTSDKDNDFKNYFFGVYDSSNGMIQKEQFNVVFNSDATYSNVSLFAEDVINDSISGSTQVKIASFDAGFKALYDAYMIANPACTLSCVEFDPFFGLDKNTRTALPNLTIVPDASASPAGAGETAIAVSSTEGVALLGGSDGSLAAEADPQERAKALNNLYLNAFNGTLDPQIKSKNRFPTTFIMDANFSKDVKLAIANLAVKRGDCMAMLDCGTGITTKASVKPYVDETFGSSVSNRVITIEPYCMKVRDPFTSKAVTVTSTYWLSGRYPSHIREWNGKHRPLAGNTFGIIDGYVRDSIYPVFDEDLDSTLMDELAEAHINFAKYNANQVVVRAMQDTKQVKQTNLSEQNNTLILLDIKRDCERLCASYEYDFSEPTDIARFNTDVEVIAARYRDAQVRSINAYFDKNSWEAERNILHLYVELVHKDLVKITIIEIDVNRSSTTES